VVSVGLLPDIARPGVFAGQPALDYSLLHEGQRQAYWSEARVTLVLAGTQGGKTVVGPPWLLRQIHLHGPGDYIVGAPSFALMEKKVLPEFRRLFDDAMGLGRYITSPVRHFRFSDEGNRRVHGDRAAEGPTSVFFGHGDNPETLESMTAKAAWLDEAGQKTFKRESFEAINRRLSIEQGPILLTTTPYSLGWLSELVREADQQGVRIINFPSLANPRFPRAEWDRAKRTLPAWKFQTFYEGRFTRPAGMIYDCFSDENLIDTFTVPDDWERILGVDFGGINTAAVWLAVERAADGTRTDRVIAYREYRHAQRTAAEHAAVFRAREPRLARGFGGSASEGQWRNEFAAAGLPLAAPAISDVELGIQRVYGLIQSRRLLVMRHLTGLRDELLSYSREVDAFGQPTERIEDKAAYHHLDALRYAVIGHSTPASTMGWI
jgi:hypothetical protein